MDSKSSIFILLYLSAAFDTADPPVNPIGKGPLRNHTPVVWVVPLIPLFQQGSSSAGSEPEPSFKPVLCLSTPKAQAQNQESVLSRLDYCNALLAGLPASSIKPLQLIQTEAERLIFNEPKRMHITLLINLHWLPVAARIKLKALMFAYKTTIGSAPLYLNELLQTYIPSRSLRSASERRITVPSQRGTKSHLRTFKLNIPSWWNDLPTWPEQLNPYPSSRIG